MAAQAGIPITGKWTGELQVAPKVAIKLIFHFENNTFSLDSPDQNAYGIEGMILHLSADSVNVRVPQLMAGFKGRLREGRIKGEFRQSGKRFPLELLPGEIKANRPQTPVAPFPYSTEELTIEAPDATLAGTLCIPSGADTNTPLVVMVTGSGLQNRDEELFEHKPFAVIADYLARNGIASFRYDDRGYGESKGDPAKATTADFATDAQAVVEYLRSTGRFGKIGLLGHSEGGMIAYMLGARQDILDFIVSIAGPTVKGSKINAYQNEVSLRSSGFSEKEATDFANAIEKTREYKQVHPITEVVSDALIAELYPEHADSPSTQKLADTLRSILTDDSEKPWITFFMGYDPVSDLKAIRIPSLLIFGEKDRQVPPSLNEAPAKDLLPTATVKIYPELNHMMQHAGTGNVDEYRTIEETISTNVLSDITTFIHLQR